MRTQRSRIEAAGFAAVAVPVPLLEPLIYRVPQPWRPLARIGVRVRVPVGRRRLIGWIVDLPPSPPVGLEKELRSIESVIDFEPLLPSDLMKLADFTASYYAAPIGEVLKSLLPGTLPAWGDRRVELTNRGALADWGDTKDRALQQFLLERGRRRMLASMLKARGGAPRRAGEGQR